MHTNQRKMARSVLGSLVALDNHARVATRDFSRSSRAYREDEGVAHRRSSRVFGGYGSVFDMRGDASVVGFGLPLPIATGRVYND